MHTRRPGKGFGADESGLVRFAVEDTGSGIPEEYLPHIFEKFFRVPGYGQQQRDSGLGLAIVKEIIDAHGGSSTWPVSRERERGSRLP